MQLLLFKTLISLICFIADSETLGHTFSSLDSMYPLRSESYLRQACREQSQCLPCGPKILTVCLEEATRYLCPSGRLPFQKKQSRRHKLATIMTKYDYDQILIKTMYKSMFRLNNTKDSNTQVSAHCVVKRLRQRSAVPSSCLAAHLFA